jgi:putative hemolysin
VVLDDPGSSPYLSAVIFLVLSAFFSGSESALLSSDHIRLKSVYGSHRRLGKVLGLKENPKAVLSSLLLGNTLVNVMFSSAVAAIAFTHLTFSRSVIDLTAIVAATVLVVIFGEISPKLIAGADSEKAVIAVSPVLAALDYVMKPFSHSLEHAASYLAKAFPTPASRAEELTEARLLAAVDFGETSGAIRNDEKEMIHGVIEAKELIATDVMIPRPNMVALQEDRSGLDALNVMLRYGVSRIPVFAESRDNITGIVHIADLVSMAGENGEGWKQALADKPVRSFSTPPYFVPEAKSVRDLLSEMKAGGIHMSIVVDEFDGVSGLVTLEDLVEEIVGDIRDEYDTRDISPIVVGETAWEVPGRMSLADLESFTGLDIEMEDCDSVAGVVMRCLDRVPDPGDSFTLDDPPVSFEVKDVKGPRIQKVVIRKRNDEVSSQDGR